MARQQQRGGTLGNSGEMLGWELRGLRARDSGDSGGNSGNSGRGTQGTQGGGLRDLREVDLGVSGGMWGGGVVVLWC